MPTIEILPITPSCAGLDAAALLFDQYRQFYGQPAQAQVSHQFLTDRLSRGESIVLFATVDAQAAGMIQLYHGFSSIACCRTMVLNDLFVSPGYRSAGIGRQLVQAAIRCAIASGAASIQLETAQDNSSAQKLYERLGFARSTGFFTYILSLDSRQREACQ